MGKRVGKYPQAFREMAVDRMKNCRSIKDLARELGVHRTVLYQWRDRVAALSRPGRQEDDANQSLLERENRQLKRLLAEKTLEVDFFKGALQKIEARRQNSSKAGETASTNRSGS